MGWTLVCGLKALGKLVELWVEKHIQTEQGEGKEVGEENEGMKGVSRRKGEIEMQYSQYPQPQGSNRQNGD